METLREILQRHLDSAQPVPILLVYMVDGTVNVYDGLRFVGRCGGAFIAAATQPVVVEAGKRWDRHEWPRRHYPTGQTWTPRIARYRGNHKSRG